MNICLQLTSPFTTSTNVLLYSCTIFLPYNFVSCSTFSKKIKVLYVNTMKVEKMTDLFQSIVGVNFLVDANTISRHGSSDKAAAVFMNLKGNGDSR